jgi:hypothetical protein
MLYEISKELGIEIAARKAPFPVVYGPERVDNSDGITTSERVIIERERPGVDVFNAGKHRNRNPKQRHSVQTSAFCRIVVKDNSHGGRIQDHERRAEKLRDLILDSMDKVIGTREQQWLPTTGGFLSADQLAGLETLKQWPGAVYEFRFTVLRGNKEVDWTSEAQPEVTFGDGANDVTITSRTRAILAGAPDGTTPETACGTDP